MEETRNNDGLNGKFVFPMIQEQVGCDCGSKMRTDASSSAHAVDQPFVTGSVPTPAGIIPAVSSVLTGRDHQGNFLARWGVGRMNHLVDPGLYALGKPDDQSAVLVAANYKMSFDLLRQAMKGRDAWILVLDTNGINVWCAAGKGTFGTNELAAKIESTGLKQIVRHRNLILPQLGAPGVAAHLIKQISGFKVHYGPVRALDLPTYLDCGLTKTDDMKIMTFPLSDRAVLIPMELVEAMKYFFIAAAVLIILAGLAGPAGFAANVINDGLFAVLALLAAVASGAILTPLLLPYLPGRAFALKGAIIGLAAAIGMIYARNIDWRLWPDLTEALAWLLIIPAISAYLAMNFTGCSTYTSLSGVKKEMRFALPLEMIALAAGLLIWLDVTFHRLGVEL